MGKHAEVVILKIRILFFLIGLLYLYHNSFKEIAK